MTEKRYFLNANNRELLARVGEYLRKCRKDAGLTIAQFADAAGISRGSVYAIETGACSYYLLIWAYEKFCNLNIAELDELISNNIKFNMHNDYGNYYPDINLHQNGDNAKKILNDKYGVNNDGE